MIAAKHPHITVDFNKSGTFTEPPCLCYYAAFTIMYFGNSLGARDAALVKIMKHRTHSLLAAFAHLGASADTVIEALRVAIIQADDLALGIIFSTAPPPGLLQQESFAKKIQEVGARLPELLELAQKLGYKYIAESIEFQMNLFAGKSVPEVTVKAFAEYFPYRRVAMVTLKPTSVRIGAIDPRTGFSPFQLEPVHTIASNGFDSYINQCAVDRVDIANLTAEHFFAEYVTLNRPVIITKSARDPNSKDTVDTWTVYNLIKQFGSAVEVGSTLQYVLINGHTRVSLRRPCTFINCC